MIEKEKRGDERKEKMKIIITDRLYLSPLRVGYDEMIYSWS